MTSRSRPRRTTRKDPWNENELITSSTSKLIDLDLVKILAKPQAWNCLEEDEKRKILDLLPEHIRPVADTLGGGSDATIPPLSQEFLRYSNDWRGGIRQFQVDLECGRYDPEWLSQADEAAKQRADGEFDKWKEEEFEQFWGQKQKIVYGSAAGEASQVKLKALVEHGVICKGDIWSYTRAFIHTRNEEHAGDFSADKKENQQTVLIEKEVKVIDVVGTCLIFAAPIGQRVIFPHHIKISDEKLVAARKSVISNEYLRTSQIRHDESSANTRSGMGTRTSRKRGLARQAGTRKKRQAGQGEDEDLKHMSNMSDEEMSAKEKRNIFGSSSEGGDPTLNCSANPAVGGTPTDMRADIGERALNYAVVRAVEQLACSGFDQVLAAKSTGDDGEQTKESSTVSAENKEVLAEEAVTESAKGTETQAKSAETRSTESEEGQAKGPAAESIEGKGEQSGGAATELTDSRERPSHGTSTICTNLVEPKEEEAQPGDFFKEGQRRLQSPTPQDELVIISNVQSPGFLESQILAIDGRFPGARSSNAWRAIRCYRNNQDIGSLWEMRHAWYLKHEE